MPTSDKLQHFLAFTGLSFLLAWALPTRGNKVRHILFAAVIAMIYSCFDELTQRFIPGRTCDLWDIAADSLGVLLGLSIYVIARQILSQILWGRSLIQGLSR